MSKWTHAICTQCWNEKNPDREPTTLINGPKEKCCFCSKETTAGIYVRENRFCSKETTAGIYVRENPAICLFNGNHENNAI